MARTKSTERHILPFRESETGLSPDALHVARVFMDSGLSRYAATRALAWAFTTDRTPERSPHGGDPKGA